MRVYRNGSVLLNVEEAQEFFRNREVPQKKPWATRMREEGWF